MEDLTRLLEPLASTDEQVRYMVHGTIDEYLLPDELLNSAYHFIERVSRAHASALSAAQTLALEELKRALDAVDVSHYAHGGMERLVQGDTLWSSARDAAQKAIMVFRV